MSRLACLVALCFAMPAAAAIEVPPACRVPNETGGFCGWAVLQTLLRTYHMDKGIDLMALRKARKIYTTRVTLDERGIRHESRILDGGLTTEGAREVLGRLKIPFEDRDDDEYDWPFVEQALAQDLGVAVAVRDYPKQGDGMHVVLMLEMASGKVHFIDPNEPEAIQVKARQWFRRHWTGWALVIKPR